jgi:HPt (histidine-containing phosphotransfer) domain-containing protein
MSSNRDVEKWALWNRSAALENVGGDKGLLSEVIRAFLAESPKLAAQIEQALLLGDPRQLELSAHSLRGGLGYLGATEISEALRKLENAGRDGATVGVADVFLGLRIRLAALWTDLEESIDSEVWSGAGRSF